MNIKDRFESKFVPEPNSGCWLWVAAVDKDGYGQFWSDGNTRHAHRTSYRLYVGEIPESLCVLHRCDVSACVNPAHLFLGTHADNIVDKVAKGRQARGDEHGSRKHPERLSRGPAHSTIMLRVAARGERHRSRTHPDSLPRGEDNGSAKLSEAEVMEVRAAKGQSQRHLAARYGVDHATIGRIRRRETWRHVE